MVWPLWSVLALAGIDPGLLLPFGAVGLAIAVLMLLKAADHLHGRIHRPIRAAGRRRSAPRAS